MSTELVVVTYRRGKAGERQICAFDDFAINEPHPDDMPETDKYYDSWGNSIADPTPTDFQNGVFIDLPTDWFGLRFQFFGQWFENQGSGIECMVDGGGAYDTFDRYFDALKKIGDKLLDEDGSRHKPDREVTFITAWNFWCTTGYEGDTDCDWELIGLVDLSRIKDIIVKEDK